MNFYTIQYTILNQGFIIESKEWNYNTFEQALFKYNELTNNLDSVALEGNKTLEICVYKEDKAHLVKLTEKDFEEI